ncbi:hypothetical protein AAIH46_17940 [Rhizobium sp. 0TCS1.26]|uniref:hypothetical protein n=1 Tax=Rhizobium sp. 0TCS1.26 TaxID=3142623 RepID=UPI003D2D07F4
MPVAARHHEMRDRVVADVDWKFAEPVKLIFMKDGSVDPARLTVELDAILRVGGGKESNISPGSGRAWRSKLAAGKAELHIDAARYEGPAFRNGDRVRAIARKGQPRFEVLRVDDRGETRLILELGEQ